MSRTRRVLATTSVVAGLIGATVVTTGIAGSTPAGASSLSVVETWHNLLPDTGSTVLGSSPALAEFSTGPAVVFGDQAGKVWALNLANGGVEPGWPATSIDHGPIDGPVSVHQSTVYVPVGDWLASHTGGYQAINQSGQTIWSYTPPQQGNNEGGPEGAIAGLTVGDYGGTEGVFGGSLGEIADAFNASNGQMLNGFPWFQGDTVGGAAALADLYGDGTQDIVLGGASTAGIAYGVQYVNGGHVRILSTSGQQLCNYNTEQPVMTAPAVGNFLSGGRTGIVATTDTYWTGQGGDNQVMGFNTTCNPQWSVTMPGIPDGSPAVIDALGNGGLQIAVTEHNSSSTAGSTYLLNGANGSTIWSTPALGAPVGAPVSVDLGGGYQDVVVTGTGGIQILDGQNGQVLWQESEQNGVLPLMQNSALVTDDGNGTVGITVAGYNLSPNDTLVVHFEVQGSNGALVNEAGGWPEFHHDAQLTGDASNPQPALSVPCTKPASPSGYYMAGSDGQVYPMGNLPYCGEASEYPLPGPVTGVASTPDGGGYYLVTSNGSVLTFGDAKFYGAASSYHPAASIVGIAVTKDGGGYWEITSRGGVYTFGDATFHGAATAYKLATPLVGIAATNDDGGYWLVTSGGGVFTFGDATFHGSETGAGNIVGVAANPSGPGYWEASSNGGVFSFDAPFYGAAFSYHPSLPVTALVAAPGGGGYWQVLSNGAVFTFGSAPFDGGANKTSPAYRIVGFSAG